MNIKSLLQGEISQDEILNYYNASLIYEELPRGIYGFVFNYENINFIIIDKHISYYKRRKTLIHELAHIELNQLCQANKDLFEFFVGGYEDEADEYVCKVKDELKIDNIK